MRFFDTKINHIFRYLISNIFYNLSYVHYNQTRFTSSYARLQSRLKLLFLRKFNNKRELSPPVNLIKLNNSLLIFEPRSRLCNSN